MILLLPNVVLKGHPVPQWLRLHCRARGFNPWSGTKINGASHCRGRAKSDNSPTLVWQVPERSCGRPPGGPVSVSAARLREPGARSDCRRRHRGITDVGPGGAGPSPSQVSRPARPSGLGNVCSAARWGKPAFPEDGKLLLKNQPASRRFLSPGPLRPRASEISSFPLRSPEKAGASTFKSM